VLVDDILKEEPYYTNDKGDEFWPDAAGTDYAQCKGLRNVQVVIVREKCGRLARLIVENGVPVYENTGIEQIGAHLDIMALPREE
jgi:hypothetical protein